MRIAFHLLLAVASLGLLLAIYFFWLLVPVTAILLYLVVRYAFVRRRHPESIRDVRLAHEARARETDLRR